MLGFYIRKLFWLLTPKPILRAYKSYLEQKLVDKKNYIESRVNYYCQLNQAFEIPSLDATTYGSYKRRGNTSYYYDLKEYLRYFPSTCKFAYHFGDETHVNSTPTLFKARPIEGDNAFSVLFKLDSPRHFRFVSDKTPYLEKKRHGSLSWRCSSQSNTPREFYA